MNAARLTVAFLAQMLIAPMACTCALNPIPVPPNLRLEDVNGEPMGELCPACDPGEGSVALEGGAGAVTPGGATVWAVNLDGTSPPVEVTAAPNGSFSLEIDANYGIIDAGGLSEEYLLQIGTVDETSLPMAVRVDLSTTELVAASRPLGDCFGVIPQLQLSNGRQHNIALINNCAETISFSSIGLRVPHPSIALSPGPTSLALGERQTVTVDFATAGPGPHEEVLLLEISAPVIDRRAVLLRGAASSK
jgi:hypothetical protein